MSKKSNKNSVFILLLILTSAVAPAQQPWRFVVTGDSRGYYNGVSTPILSELAREVVNTDADFLLFVGDLISGGFGANTQSQLNTWLTTMQPVYNAQIPVYVIRGNHEDNSFFPDISVWHNTFSGPYAMPANGPPGETNLTYSFTHKNAFIAGLDEYVNDYQLNQPWLDTQLAHNINPHVFVFGHLPAFQSMPRECLDEYPDKRDAFWQSLQNAGARTYLCSHDHYYDHARIDDGDGNPDNDIHQYIIGTAGAPLYTYPVAYEGANSLMTPINIARAKQYGYVIVDIDNLDVTMTCMTRTSLDPLQEGIYEPNDIWTYSVKEITLLSPNGPEQIIASTDYTITWKTEKFSRIQNVRLEFFDGLTWNPINDTPHPADTASYLWSPVPAVDSDACLIRISDWYNPSASDTSPSFTIFQCQLSSPADINNDCYIDMQDFIIMASEWLKCGNPLDPACATD